LKIRLIASSLDAEIERQNLTSYLVNETLAVDAGCIGLIGGPVDQGRIRHVLISHTHIDHIATLPILAERIYQARGEGITILGSQAVIDALRAHIFNDQVWPDLIRLSSPESPLLKYQAIASGQAYKLDGLSVTPFEVDHVVPTQGFLISDGNASAIIASDSGPTDTLWSVANTARNLKAIFLDISFPDEMTQLARLAKHMTPAMLAQEVLKLTGNPLLIAVHLKPRYRPRIINELDRLGLPNLVIGSPLTEYDFS
jgi:cAMP phosphodiesterase